MKPSGVSWLGDIPAEWRIERIKWVADLIVDRAASSQCYIGLENIESGSGRFIATQPNVTEGAAIAIKPNDVLFGKLRPYLAKCHLAEWEGCCSSEFLVLRANKCNPRFLQYSLLSPAFLDYVNMSTYGTKMPRANWEIVGGACMSFPPLPEQRVIAAFLDEKCEAIDVLVDEVKASLAEYADWKRSIIFHAVTEGISADGGGRLSLKDSGVKWIGTIPTHWQVLPLKTHSDMLTPMRDRPEHLDGPIPWIRIEDFDGKYIAGSKDGLGVSKETVRLMNLKVYPVGTVLCTSSCDLGKCAIVSTPLVSNQRFIGIVPKAGLHSDFLYYLMLSNAERLNMLSTGTIQANLSRVEFERLQVQIPPLAEQHAIAAWLDEKCMAIDALVEEKKRLLDDLASYKKSLIYETVTGKRRVLR
jgi:type I restriction enzyme S subunit